MRTCSVADPTVVRMTVSLSCTLLLLTAVQLSVGTAFINVYSKKLLWARPARAAPHKIHRPLLTLY